MSAPYPGRICPSCGGPADGQTAFHAGDELGPGAVVICIHCGGLALVDEQLVLRVPPEWILATLEREPDVIAARRIVSLYRRRN